MFKINEASWDRIVRAVVGAALLVLALVGVVTGGLGILLGAVGAVLLVTGTVGFCPLYAVARIRTRGA